MACFCFFLSPNLFLLALNVTTLPLRLETDVLLPFVDVELMNSRVDGCSSSWRSSSGHRGSFRTKSASMAPAMESA
ncbi:hypothetical protein C8J56DRAFT_921564 [Mycena floridula]|nr:hypothetical protein C8J56DRAFT_921564 [Mycena floridula]